MKWTSGSRSRRPMTEDGMGVVMGWILNLLRGAGKRNRAWIASRPTGTGPLDGLDDEQDAGKQTGDQDGHARQDQREQVEERHCRPDRDAACGQRLSRRRVDHNVIVVPLRRGKARGGGSRLAPEAVASLEQSLVLHVEGSRPVLGNDLHVHRGRAPLQEGPGVHFPVDRIVAGIEGENARARDLHPLEMAERPVDAGDENGDERARSREDEQDPEGDPGGGGEHEDYFFTKSTVEATSVTRISSPSTTKVT